MRKAFTLIEVLTVIFILGVLFAITGSVYTSALVRSRDNQRKQDIDQIHNALEQFYADYHHYPQLQDNPNNILAAKWQLEKVSGNGCTYSNTKQFLVPHYLSSVPQDPQHTLQLTGSSCNDTSQNKGEYLYTAVSSSDTTLTPKQYYLMAKMERSQNASWQAPAASDLTPYSAAFASIPLCTQASFSESCGANYYVKTSRND